MKRTRGRSALIGTGVIIALLLPFAPGVLAASARDYIVVLKDGQTVDSLARALRNREYRALIGVFVVAALLIAKWRWLGH